MERKTADARAQKSAELAKAREAAIAAAIATVNAEHDAIQQKELAELQEIADLEMEKVQRGLDQLAINIVTG